MFDVIVYFLAIGAPSIVAWCFVLGGAIVLFLSEKH